MNQQPFISTGERNLLVRALLMVLMAIIFHLSGTLLFFIAIIQLALALLNDEPNARLAAFGRSLGNYLKHVVSFLTFASEEVPFPFSDWPASD